MNQRRQCKQRDKTLLPLLPVQKGEAEAAPSCLLEQLSHFQCLVKEESHPEMTKQKIWSRNKAVGQHGKSVEKVEKESSR